MCFRWQKKMFRMLGEKQFSVKQKISTMQRYIIVHSILYYEKNSSVIPDKKFDDVAKELVKYKNKYREEYKKSEYYYCMKDFDGSTGFDLYSKLTWEDRAFLEAIANDVLTQYKFAEE